MLEAEPFNPLVYWLHVVLGIGSVFLVLGAIFAVKGSRPHRIAGIGFSLAMGIAASTAVIFSFSRFAPPGLFSAFSVAYGIAMGILSLRKRSGGWKALQWFLVGISLVLTLVGIAAIVSLFFAPLPLPVILLIMIPATGVVVFFAIITWKDIGFLRDSQPGRLRRYRRHALRMSIAAAEVIRAPLISFGPPIGPDGVLTFPLYFFVPFLLIPLIYFLAMPGWVKQGNGAATQPA